jgi:hypothetical protein
MNKIWVALLVVVGLVYSMSASDCYALFGKKKAKAAAEENTQEVRKAATETAAEKTKTTAAEPKSVEKQVPATVSPDQEKQRTLREQKRAQLNNTQWSAELLAMSGEGKKHKDVLIFKDNHFSSEAYVKQGFAATNYTVSVQEDGSLVWETMQTAADGQLVFWRGEVSSDMKSMRGVVSKQKAGGESEDYSFVCGEKTVIAQ